jgi:arylsulfatase/uncharacterized sulfatase
VGDNQWHLYDISADPGEVNDVRLALPLVFAAMLRDYADYARDNGVLPMPPGYDYKVQGQLYAVHHVLLPKLRAALPATLAALAAIALLCCGLVRRRRRGKVRP